MARSEQPVTDGAEVCAVATRSADPAPQERHWHACYTRSRHEKKVAQYLDARGFETFLPLVDKERQWKDRVTIVPFPLFPSYVFARIATTELHPVLATPGVSTIVRSDGKPARIVEDEIENMRLFAERLRGNERVVAEPVPYVAVGEPVRLMEGPFQNLEGVVVEHRGRRRILVGLTALRQGFEVDVPLDRVKQIRR